MQLLSMPVACITFAQPLWQKATEIVLFNRHECRLGGFLTFMNFLRAVSSVMSGSGLAEALQCCCGPISVTHILTGKAFSKALCGHNIVDSALPVLLTRTHLEQLGTEELNALKETYAVTASSRACLLYTSDAADE